MLGQGCIPKAFFFISDATIRKVKLVTLLHACTYVYIFLLRLIRLTCSSVNFYQPIGDCQGEVSVILRKMNKKLIAAISSHPELCDPELKIYKEAHSELQFGRVSGFAQVYWASTKEKKNKKRQHTFHPKSICAHDESAGFIKQYWLIMMIKYQSQCTSLRCSGYCVFFYYTIADFASSWLDMIHLYQYFACWKGDPFCPILLAVCYQTCISWCVPWGEKRTPDILSDSIIDNKLL